MAKSKSKARKERSWVLQAQMISVLRRLFVRSPMFTATRKAAQVEYTEKNKDGTDSKARRVKYRCAICGQLFKDEKIVYETSDRKGKIKQKRVHSIAVDHVDEFIPETGLPVRENGLPDWNILIDRMFLGVTVWDPNKNSYDDISSKSRILCWKCHNVITQEQNARRREHKKAKKKAKSKS